MCHSTKVLNLSENGKLVYCYSCEDFQIEYKVIQFSLSKLQLNYLIHHSNELLVWCKNVESYNVPKVSIPILVQKQFLNLTFAELIEFNQLITGEKATVESLTSNFSVN